MQSLSPDLQLPNNNYLHTGKKKHHHLITMNSNWLVHQESRTIVEAKTSLWKFSATKKRGKMLFSFVARNKVTFQRPLCVDEWAVTHTVHL